MNATVQWVSTQDRRLMTMRAYRTIGKGLLIVLAGVLLGVLTVAVSSSGVGEDDFLVYWSAARLLTTGGNPYDPLALRTLERETRPGRGEEYGRAFASWNPPWLLVVLLPFGLLPFDLSVLLWKLCSIGLIVAASALTWRMLTEPADRRGILLVAGVSLWSGQALSALVLGQVSSLVLMALVLGAWWLHTSRDRLAGAALFLATIKPQVTYLVLLLLLLWVIRHRRWQVLWGMIAVAAMSMAIVWIVFPRWVPAYVNLLSGHRSLLFQYATATVGSLVEALWGTNLFRFAGLLLLPFVPSLLQLVDSWGWLTAMNAALLISVPLAPYGFNADQVVLFPAIIQIISWLWRRDLPLRRAWMIGGGLAAVCLASFAMLFISFRYCYWFALIPLALAGLYAAAWNQRTAPPAASVLNSLAAALDSTSTMNTG
jgi:hypothetical protein